MHLGFEYVSCYDTRVFLNVKYVYKFTLSCWGWEENT